MAEGKGVARPRRYSPSTANPETTSLYSGGPTGENARGQRERLDPKVSGGRGAVVGGPGKLLPAAVGTTRGPGSPPPAVQPSPSRWPHAKRRTRPHTHLGQGPEAQKAPTQNRRLGKVTQRAGAAWGLPGRRKERRCPWPERLPDRACAPQRPQRFDRMEADSTSGGGGDVAGFCVIIR